MARRRAAKASYSLCPNCVRAEFLPSGLGSGRSHKDTWAGCIVSLTTSTRSLSSASRSVSSRSLRENCSSVFLASYFLL